MSRRYFVTCTCGKRMHVGEEHFGKTGKCVKCRKPITITPESVTPIDATPSAVPVAQGAPAPAHGGRAVGSMQAVVADSGTAWALGQVVLNEYVVERKLGEGGMGAVYLLVRSQSTGHRFAVKKTRFRDEVSRRGFLDELRVWIDMPEHPHLAACRFFRTVEGELVIFAEYVEGGALSSWIAEGRLTGLDQILDVAIQSAWGLHAAHELGLVHQDMKPGNVLMTMEGVAKLTDFGLARARARAGEAPLRMSGGAPLGGVLGTPYLICTSLMEVYYIHGSRGQRDAQEEVSLPHRSAGLPRDLERQGMLPRFFRPALSMRFLKWRRSLT